MPFGEAEPGATGLELLLPLTLKWAHEDSVPLAAALARITAAPAAVLGCRRRAASPSAQPADVCVFDPDAHWTVERGALRARARTRRSSGSKSRAGCAYTLVGGQVVHES